MKDITDDSESLMVLCKTLSDAAVILGLSQADLGAALVLTDKEKGSLREGNVFLKKNTRQWARGICIIYLYRRLSALMGSDEENIRFWMKTENTHLDGVPEELMKTTEGLLRLIEYHEFFAMKMGTDYGFPTTAALLLKPKPCS